ncbi:MAG: ABC transporter permease, partial [Alphaproteobacteria bacterium]
PLSLPGLVVGAVLVFTGSLTSFTTPQLLGGDGSTVLSTLIFRQAMVLFDWSGAATIATIMVVLTLSVITIINMAARRLNPAA